MHADRKAITRRLAGAAAIVVALAAPAHAVDGVIEINQARALAGGVTAGDEPGFPVTISQPGSYRLTGSLTVPDANTTAIVITESFVTVDLNGFSIVGPVVCSGTPTTCTGAGTGLGIDAQVESVAVVNGIVRGLGSTGIRLGSTSRVERVHATGNGGSGISVNTGIVRDGIASRNGATGIVAGAESSVTGNIASRNVGLGMFVGGRSTVIGNTAASNGSYGLQFDAFGAGGFEVGGGYGNNVLVLNSGSGNNNNLAVIGGPKQIGPNVCGSALCP